MDENQGINVAESGRWLRYLGAWNGLQMDGGGSTMMAVVNPSTQAVQVVNNPSSVFLHGTRPVGNSLGIYYITEPEQIPMEDWLAFRNVPELDRGDGDDLTGEGFVNIEKYVWNIHPQRGLDPSDEGALPVYDVYEAPSGDRYLSVLYRLNRHAVDADLIVETTADLLLDDWDISHQVEIDALSPDPVTHDPRYRARVPMDSDEPLFLRLRVIRIEP